jgi:predicted DNA-binding protein with PD1-like motif
MASQISTHSSAVVVLSCVGSLSSLTLRMANATPNGSYASQCRTWNEPLEILSLSGTVVPQTTQFHLHMTASDATGCVYGGHLMHGTVHSTVELTLGTIASVVFDRKFDPDTGYRELVISSTATASK